jgi:hypothetical protein
MPNTVAFTDNSHLARNKTPKPRITPRVKAAIEIMINTGADYQAAAAQVGMSTYGLRLALEKPHIAAHYRAQCQVLRDASRARNIHRLFQIRDAADNLPAVNAVKALMGLDDEPLRTANAADARGVTIRILNVVPAPSTTPNDPAFKQIIDAEQ